jgi:NADH:ubiquinone oxidoreductase subunit 3 (subunit A)
MMGLAVSSLLAGVVLFGFGMFLWGTLVRSEQHQRQKDGAYTDGFRDGWEAAEQFDNDVRIIWGGKA